MSGQMWWEKASCRNKDPRLFDSVERGSHAYERIQRALSYCEACPVVATCFDEAVANRDDGVRGGFLLIAGRIQKPPAAPRRPAKQLAPCGTNTAWVRHRRNHVHCDVCETARAEARALKGAGRKKAA